MFCQNKYKCYFPKMETTILCFEKFKQHETNRKVFTNTHIKILSIGLKKLFKNKKIAIA